MDALLQLGLPTDVPCEPGVRQVTVTRFGDDRAPTDWLAVEEPLEIRVRTGPLHDRVTRSISVTMRTPGADADLAIGFLLTEGLIREPAQVLNVESCGPPRSHGTNIVRVDLAPDVELPALAFERHFYASSSCGICGKASLEAIAQACPPELGKGPIVSATLINALPARLRARQSTFARTGGIHAAGLFDIVGKLLSLREDIGRHNALDQLIGSEFRNGRLPASDCILLVSGRAGFELIQKAVMAGIPIVAAVGAPSSLAVESAERFGMTLLGFVRDGRCNVYSHPQRIQEALPHG